MTAKKYDYWVIHWQKHDKHLGRYTRGGEMFHTQKELLETAKKKKWAIVRDGSSNSYTRVNPSTGKIAHVKDGKMIVPEHHNLPKNMAVLVGDDPVIVKPKNTKKSTAKTKTATIAPKGPNYTVKVKDYYRKPPR